MDNSMIEIVQGTMNVIQPMLPVIVSSVLTVVLTRGNTKRAELDRLKSGKYGEALDELLESGEITYRELHSVKNFLKIAEILDKYYSSEESRTEDFQKPIKGINFDWLLRFYDYSRNISDEDMQHLWAHILGKEIEEPDSIPFSLLNALYLMTKEQAEQFANICRFALRGHPNDDPVLFLYVQKNRDSYEKSNITPTTLSELERFGLVKCDFYSEYVIKGYKKLWSENRIVEVYGDPSNESKILCGNVVFTKEGVLLYKITDKTVKHYHSQSILDFTISRLKHRKCRVFINGMEV